MSDPTDLTIPVVVVGGVAILGGAWGLAVGVGEVVVLIVFLAFIVAVIATAASK